MDDNVVQEQQVLNGTARCVSDHILRQLISTGHMTG